MANVFHKIGNAIEALRGAGSANKQAIQSFGPASIVDGQFWQEYKSLTTSFFGVSSDNEIIEAITECPQVGSILFNKCNAYINGRTEVLQVANDNPVRGLKKDWQKFINRPNILQSGSQFKAQLKFYIMAFGYCPVLRIMPDGFETGTNITGMWILPPHSTEIVFKKGNPMYETDFYDLIDYVKIEKDGKKYIIPKEDVYIFTDTTPLRVDSYLPSSRISILKYPINNIVKGYKSEGRMISKPLGILSNTAQDNISNISLDPLEKDQLKSDLNKYGTGDGLQDIIITDVALKWEHMMYPVAEMQVIELRNSNSAAICDGLGYPFDLTGKEKGSTFNNSGNADKLLYQNYIIPEAINIDEQFGECLFAELNKVRYVTTYVHIPALQENAKEKAEVDKTNTETLLAQFNSYVITYGQLQEGLKSRDINKSWDQLYKYQIPEFNNKQNENNNNQNADAGGNQGN